MKICKKHHYYYYNILFCKFQIKLQIYLDFFICGGYNEKDNTFAGIAQSVEQRIRNAQVACSSHVSSSTANRVVKPFGGNAVLLFL